jgi:hypothetical protein
MISNNAFLWFMYLNLGLLAIDTETFLTTDLSLSRFLVAVLIRFMSIGILVWAFETYGEEESAQ